MRGDDERERADQQCNCDVCGFHDVAKIGLRLFDDKDFFSSSGNFFVTSLRKDSWPRIARSRGSRQVWNQRRLAG